MNPALLHREVTAEVIDAAMKVHRELGPGLLENAYRICLRHELARRGREVRAEVAFPVHFAGRSLDCGFRADLLVDDRVIVELKSVDKLLPIHDARLLPYLKLANIRVGLLLNFNTTSLSTGFAD